MNIEKERKFLLKEFPEDAKEMGNIRQGYMMLDTGKQFRVRIYDSGEFGNQAFVCYKVDKSDTERFEFEYEIPLEDAEEMFRTCDLVLFKKRFYTKFGDAVVHIDKYEHGLIVCEIEYDEPLTSLPTYVGKEVTGKKKYSNINLAKNVGKNKSKGALFNYN